MASKGKFVLGTDGTDSKHRQRVGISHLQSVEAKRWLRLTFYPHILMFFLIALKLSEDVLDRADIFILELQELQIPKPDLWEWFYAASILFVPFAFRAMSKNSIVWLRLFHLGIWVCGLLPVLVGTWKYYADFMIFAQERDVSLLQYTWRKIPLAVVFQGYGVLALQIHCVQLYFSYKMLKIWSGVQRKKIE